MKYSVREKLLIDKVFYQVVEQRQDISSGGFKNRPICTCLNQKDALEICEAMEEKYGIPIKEED